MAGKTKYYVVWYGLETGVFSTWNECQLQIKGVKDAKYKSYPSLEEAKAAYEAGWQEALRPRPSAPRIKEAALKKEAALPRPEGDYLAVDAACSGNPGKMEYRCVRPLYEMQVFHQGPFLDGTNNIGEFLAIVHALALQKQQHTCLPVYSDSANALLWVAKKKCATKLNRTGRNQRIFELIERAETWLRTHTYSEIPLLKWRTDMWGEIPADFGRK